MMCRWRPPSRCADVHNRAIAAAHSASARIEHTAAATEYRYTATEFIDRAAAWPGEYGRSDGGRSSSAARAVACTRDYRRSAGARGRSDDSRRTGSTPLDPSDRLAAATAITTDSQRCRRKLGYRRSVLPDAASACAPAVSARGCAK